VRALKHCGKKINRSLIGVSLNFLREILFFSVIPTLSTMESSILINLNNAFTRVSRSVIEKSINPGKMNFSVLNEYPIRNEPMIAIINKKAAKYTTASPIIVNKGSISIAMYIL
jgi:hypothetical protein